MMEEKRGRGKISMYCKFCGNETKEGQKFCTGCGRALEPLSNSVPKKRHSGRNSLILGIICFILNFTGWLPIFFVLCCIGICLICGVMSIIEGFHGIKTEEKGMAIAGIVITILSFCYLVFSFFLGLFLVYSGYLV